MSFLSSLIVLTLLTLTYGQKFDDYFDLEDVQTNKPPQVTYQPSEMPTTQSTTLSSTTPQPKTTSSTTTSIPSTTTSIPPTTTSTNRTTTSTNRTTTSTSLQICNCDDILQEISRGFEKIEKRIEDMFTHTTISTTTTTTTTTTDDNKIDRFFDDVFDEFEETIKSQPEKPGKRSRKINEDFEGMLIISLSSAAAGITVLIVVTLFLCLRRSKPTKTGGEEDDQNNQENRMQLHVYDELKPKMAVPEDISFIDEEEEETTTPTVTDQQPKGFIGVKGFH